MGGLPTPTIREYFNSQMQEWLPSEGQYPIAIT
jgi:hypothetical protein